MSNSHVPRRSVFFISDGTGITAETLGYALLTQFEGLPTRQTRVPFIDSVDKAHASVARINQAHLDDGVRPIVFNTLVDAQTSSVIHQANALVLNNTKSMIKSALDI